MPTSPSKHCCRTVALAALFLVFAGVAAPTAARAHMPPQIYMTIHIDAENVTWETIVSAGIFNDWLGLEAKNLNDLEGRDLEAAQKQIEAFFEQYGRVLIDRLPVTGVLESFEYTVFTDHGIPWEYVKVTMVYGTKGMPRQVALAWTNYDGGLGGYFEMIESEIEAMDETQYYVFCEEEPEIVWHAPRVPRVRRTPPLPVARPPPHVTLPILSVALLLLAFLAFPVLKARGVGRPARWGVVAVGAALSVGVLGVLRTEVTLPFGGGFERPSEEEARYIFESLHRNVYRAFDYDSEDEIYDTLARCVKGELLDDVYTEVYESLVLQEEGGAVCKIQRVDILETEIRFPNDEDTPFYGVRARWQVHGKVGHWGHTHIRVNEYEAVYTLVLEDSAWKIADVKVLSQERMDDGSRRGG